MKTQGRILLLTVVICLIFTIASPALAYYQVSLNCEITDDGLEPAALKVNWWLTSSWGCAPAMIGKRMISMPPFSIRSKPVPG